MKNLILIILIILSGCSASHHARKALKKNPNSFKADTTVVIDTVMREGAKTVLTLHDTVFVLKDTTIYQDRIKIRFLRDSSNRPIMIVDCPEEATITKTETIEETIILDPPRKPWYKKIFTGAKTTFIMGIILAVVCLLIFIRLK